MLACGVRGVKGVLIIILERSDHPVREDSMVWGTDTLDSIRFLLGP